MTPLLWTHTFTFRIGAPLPSELLKQDKQSQQWMTAKPKH